MMNRNLLPCVYFTQIFFKNKFFIWPTTTPNKSETPSVIYCWKAYAISERNVHLKILNLVLWKIAPEKKTCQKNWP